MRLRSCLTVFATLASLCAPASAEPVPVAVFDFDLINTSPAPSTDEELARAKHLGALLREALVKSGKYTIVDTAPVKAALAEHVDIRDCNGCELPLAQKLGAKVAMVGWVQKVSNLILNINVVIESVPDGKPLGGGSVDIRGNTDESWTRGLKFLVEEHVLNDQ